MADDDYQDEIPTDQDEPVAQYLKVVHLLRCAPGYAKNPMDGVPIVIVTLEHNMEVEQPLMFKIPEAQKLAYGLLAGLAYHGDEQAQEIVREYFKKKED